MLKKILTPALILVALAAFASVGVAQAAEEVPAAEVVVSDAVTAAAGGASCGAVPVVSTEEPGWESALGEGPIGGLPYPCPGAFFQYRWVQDGCCPGSIGTAKANWKQEERFYCEGSGWSYWYHNYQTKCEGSCLIM